MSDVSKEVDAWLDGMTKLMKAKPVEENTSKMLADSVEYVLKQIGNEKLQQMDAAGVLVAVRNGLPKAPMNLLRPEFIQKSSDQVAKIVEDYFAANKIVSAGLKTLGDGVVNELEAQIAKYIASLPKDVDIKRDGLTIVLSKEGVAAKIETDGWSISPDPEPTAPRAKLSIETKDLKLNLESQGKAVRFDGQLKYVKKDLDVLVELEARTGKYTEGSSEGVALQGKIDATYKKVELRAKASLEQFETKIQYLSEDPGLKKVVAQLESDYETVKAKFDLFFKKRDTEVMVKAVASAEKLEVDLNAKTVTAGGTNVVAEVKANEERVAAKLAVFKKNDESSKAFVAGLESDYKQLRVAAQAVYTKSGAQQIQAIAKFEATLDRVRASIEAAVQTDSWRASVGASIDSKGAVSGKVEALAKLGQGFQITGQNAYVRVGASVDDKRWNLFVGISLTNPPKAADVKKLFSTAERNIKGAYGVLNDSAYDGADSAKVLSEMQRKLQSKPPSISLDAGVFIGGGIPQAGLPTLPISGGAGIQLTLRF